MKHTRNTNSRIIPFPGTKAPKYPNAADRKYYMNKIVDYMLSVVTGAGIGVAMVFIFVVL